MQESYENRKMALGSQSIPNDKVIILVCTKAWIKSFSIEFDV